MRRLLALVCPAAMISFLLSADSPAQESVLLVQNDKIYEQSDNRPRRIWTTLDTGWQCDDLERDVEDAGYYAFSNTQPPRVHTGVSHYDESGKEIGSAYVGAWVYPRPGGSTPSIGRMHLGGLLLADENSVTVLYRSGRTSWSGGYSIFRGARLLSVRPRALQDLLTGNYLFLNIGLSRPALVSVDPATLTSITLATFPSATYIWRVWDQDIFSGSVYMASYVTGRYVALRPGGTVTTITPPKNAAVSTLAARNEPNEIDGTLYMQAQYGTGWHVVRWDPVSQAYLWISRGGARYGYNVIVSHRPRGLTTEWAFPSTNAFWLNVHFPGLAGKPYVVAVSLSGCHPEFPIPKRRILLNPDWITAAGLAGALDPYLQNWTGLLDANGRARATLDLRTLGNAVFGARVWAVAAALDAAAPDGIARLSVPVVVVADSKGS